MRWEYLTIVSNMAPDSLSLMHELDTLGIDRWELVAVVYDTLHTNFVYYFKRERLERIG